MANKEQSYIYIFTNPSFREDWVKIGKTKNVSERLRSLDNTSVPLPFEKYATLKTSKYNEAEELVHDLIDKFTTRRIRKNREFFNLTPQEALDIFCKVAKILDDAEIEICSKDKTKIPCMLKKHNKNKSDNSENGLIANNLEINTPRLESKKVLPRYFSHLNSNFVIEVLKELNCGEDISKINNIKVLENVRSRIKEKEKVLKYHNTHSCSISQYIKYLENGLSYQDYEHDSQLVKMKLKKR